MHSDSEDLTIFIIFFDSYKYHVMFFELINKLTFYQHYMNDMLFKYLLQFCQIYLDNIIIYSKILKKHKWHVQLILNKLQEADLQINIDKCKFHVQKIIFLELLMSIKRLKMNSQKMQAVVDWSTLNNLTQMQFFINFCNFYQRFIKNFSKIVHSIIQLTQKKSYLNEMKSVRLSSIIWRDVWSKLLYYVTLIKLVRLFLKLTHSTTLMMKFSLNMMMKKYYIQLSFIARTCFLLNAITRYMIKNFWSSFEHLNTDDSNWN